MWYMTDVHNDSCKRDFKTLESLLSFCVTDNFIANYINKEYAADECFLVFIPYYGVVSIGTVTVMTMRGIGKYYTLKEEIIKKLTAKILNDTKPTKLTDTICGDVIITRDSVGDEPPEPEEEDDDDDYEFDAEELDMIRNGCSCRCVGCDYVIYNDENNKFYCTAVQSETKDIYHCPYN